MIKKFSIAIILIFWAGECNAEITTLQLYQFCKKAAESVENSNDPGTMIDAFKSGECVGYISSYMDARVILKIENVKIKGCFPADGSITFYRVIKLFTEYLEKHPKDFGVGPFLVLTKVGAESFPCHGK